MIELADWVGPFHRQKYAGVFDDSPCVLKLQYSSTSEYLPNYRKFRYIGYDTNLLEKSIGKTQNQRRDKILWMGRLACGRGEWMARHPAFVDQLAGAPSRFSVVDYYAFASNFRFGLSLPGGHGASLCHREVEYLALGVVPVMPDPICLSDPPFIPFINYIPVQAFTGEILHDDGLYQSMADTNKQLFLDSYTNEKWAEDASRILGHYL